MSRSASNYVTAVQNKSEYGIPMNVTLYFYDFLPYVLGAVVALVAYRVFKKAKRKR